MYNLLTGEIQSGVLYIVGGAAGTVVYNGNTKTSGQTFRGVIGVVDFTVTGDGVVNEVFELWGCGVSFTIAHDEGYTFPDPISKVIGAAVVFDLNDEEKIVQEVTRLQGFSIALKDVAYDQITTRSKQYK